MENKNKLFIKPSELFAEFPSIKLFEIWSNSHTHTHILMHAIKWRSC